MGFSQSYRCKTCQLGATVSGGDDIGFYARTQTRYCPKCETLVDVCTELWCKELLPGLLPEGRLDELLELENKYGQCHHCQNVTETVWCVGDPCPRCGGVVEATGEEMMDSD